MSSSQQEILFFETIAHDGEIDQVKSKHFMTSVRIGLIFVCQVLQVDEIKFEQPVYIDEIRILPLGYNAVGPDKATTRVGYE